MPHTNDDWLVVIDPNNQPSVFDDDVEPYHSPIDMNLKNVQVIYETLYGDTVTKTDYFL
jgi:hypothetical protein